MPLPSATPHFFSGLLPTSSRIVPLPPAYVLSALTPFLPRFFSRVRSGSFHFPFTYPLLATPRYSIFTLSIGVAYARLTPTHAPPTRRLRFFCTPLTLRLLPPPPHLPYAPLTLRFSPPPPRSRPTYAEHRPSLRPILRSSYALRTPRFPLPPPNLRPLKLRSAYGSLARRLRSTRTLHLSSVTLRYAALTLGLRCAYAAETCSGRGCTNHFFFLRSSSLGAVFTVYNKN